MRESRKTALYRYFDANLKLLYVGIAFDPIIRQHAHKQRSWYAEVSTMEIDWFDSRAEAAIAERKAIRLENPKHNRHIPGIEIRPSEEMLKPYYAIKHERSGRLSGWLNNIEAANCHLQDLANSFAGDVFTIVIVPSKDTYLIPPERRFDPKRYEKVRHLLG